MSEYLPGQATLPRFADGIYWPFDAQGFPSGELPPRFNPAGPGVPGGARVGPGAGATERREVSQADGLPEQPGLRAGPNEQLRGADQPDGSLPGEGALQVAATPATGTIPYAEAGSNVERPSSSRGANWRGSAANQPRPDTRPSRPAPASRNVTPRSSSARSVPICRA
jgi:hypothetical protein